MTTEMILTVLLGVTWIILAALGLVYLTRRKLSWQGYLGWGLLALLVPLLGPFLVVCACPGERKSAADRSG